MKACFTNKIRKFVGKKFNSELASTLGLALGTQKIFVIFKMDKTGDSVDVKARATHVRLQEEGIRVVDLLTKMKPGMQQNRPVSVKYSLPIAFQVE